MVNLVFPPPHHVYCLSRVGFPSWLHVFSFWPLAPHIVFRLDKDFLGNSQNAWKICWMNADLQWLQSGSPRCPWGDKKRGLLVRVRVFLFLFPMFAKSFLQLLALAPKWPWEEQTWKIICGTAQHCGLIIHYSLIGVSCILKRIFLTWHCSVLRPLWVAGHGGVLSQP